MERWGEYPFEPWVPPIVPPPAPTPEPRGPFLFAFVRNPFDRLVSACACGLSSGTRS